MSKITDDLARDMSGMIKIIEKFSEEEGKAYNKFIDTVKKNGVYDGKQQGRNQAFKEFEQLIDDTHKSIKGIGNSKADHAWNDAIMVFKEQLKQKLKEINP